MSQLPLLPPFDLILHCTVLYCCAVLRCTALCRCRCLPEIPNSAHLSLSLTPISLRLNRGTARTKAPVVNGAPDDNSWKCASFHELANHFAQCVSINVKMTNETHISTTVHAESEDSVFLNLGIQHSISLCAVSCLFLGILSSSQDMMHCQLSSTVCTCTTCQRASYNSTTDSFIVGSYHRGQKKAKLTLFHFEFFFDS